MSNDVIFADSALDRFVATPNTTTPVDAEKAASRQTWLAIDNTYLAGISAA